MLHARGLPLYLLVLACLLLQLLSPESRAWLELRPGTLWAGEYWRLFSGHFIHAGWWHWWLNALGIALLQQLLGRYLPPPVWIGCCVVSAVLISAGLGLLSSYRYYLGFSGILHALFVLAALNALGRETFTGAAVLALVTVKVILEQTLGPTAASARLIGIAVATDAHWLGVVAGVSCYLAGGIARARCRGSR